MTLVAPFNGSSSHDDDFWRAQDALLGVTPDVSSGRPAPSHPPTLPPSTSQSNGHSINGHGVNGHGVNGHGVNGHGVNGHATAGGADEVRRLEAQLNDALSRAAVLERRADELKAGLQTTVSAFNDQLADLEREHEQRKTTIRVGAQAAADRIVEDARRRAAEIAAMPTNGPTHTNTPSSRPGDDHAA